MIIWVANFILKDIASLTDFDFNLDTRKLYVQVQLVGESEAIEVWMDDFAIVRDGESYEFIVQQTKSNRIWLHNLLARIAGKKWKIPVIPQLAAYIGTVAEVFKAEKSEQSEAIEANADTIE